MSEVKIKGTIKAINIRGATFLLPLLNDEVTIVFPDPQAKLPLEEE